MLKPTGEMISDIRSPCLHGTAVGMALLPKNEIAVLNWRTKAITKIDHLGNELQVRRVIKEGKNSRWYVSLSSIVQPIWLWIEGDDF